MTAPAIDAPSCPKCGGACWDNRLSKRSPKAPDFKCRDRSCDGCIWPPRAARAVTPADAPSVLAPAADLPQPASAPPAGHGGEKLAGCYLACVRFVLEKVRPEYERAGITMDAAAVSAVTAQLFIARCRGGK